MIKIFLILTIFLVSTFGVYWLISFLFAKWGAVQKRLTKESLLETLKHLPELSQISSKKKVILIKLFFGLNGFILFFLFTDKLFLSLPFGLIGFFLPGFLSGLLTKKQINKFNHQLIDGLTVIANSLRAGTSFQQGLEILVRESKPPLSNEFAKVTSEIRLGIPISQALINLTERVKSQDLRLVITTVNIARETGGNLSELLCTIAETMRERNKLQGKIEALTAQGKMSGFIVGAMPFFLLFIFYFMAPEMIEPMFNTTLGNLMLGVVIILVALGGFLIKKIVTIDI